MFNSFIENLMTDGVVCMRISDSVLDEEDWGIDGLTIKGGVVIKQLHLSKGAYTMPNVVGWTTAQLMEWTQYDPTGQHPEQYYELSVEKTKEEVIYANERDYEIYGSHDPDVFKLRGEEE